MIRFEVRGEPKPRGSKRAFVIPGKNGSKPRAIITDDCKNSGDWMGDVKRAAVSAMSGPPLTGELVVEIFFTMPRPKAHYRSKGDLKPNAPIYHSKKPDVDKLSRAILDSLKGICWIDDAQVSHKTVIKRYGDQIGASVHIDLLT